MTSFNRTFDEARSIRVLVVPIGDNSLFDKHFEVVSRIRSLPVFDLNRPSEWKSQDSCFNSNMLFDFLRYDRVANGPSDLENFQCARRILIIIGVINYPEIESSSTARLEQDMDYYTRRHPHVILKRYFVFNYFAAVAAAPSSSPPSLPFANNPDPYAMVVFPPDGECEGGSMLDVHTKEVLGNISVRLFQALDLQMTACDDLRGKLTSANPPLLPTWLPLSTIFDDMEDGTGSASAGEVSRRMKKRLPGRLRKWMGDLCMQVCSPIDAWDHYVNAINECRGYNDTMWLAGSLEGSVAAMLAMLNLGSEAEAELLLLVKDIKALIANGTVSSNTAAVVRISEDRCVEALSLYAKNIAWCVMEAGCCLSLAKIHEMLNTSMSEKQQKVMEFVLRAAAVPGLNVPQQIECTVEGAFICLRLNMYRKYAFLVYFAALLSADSENASVAHSLARAACKHYGIQLKACVAGGDNEVEVVQVDNPGKSWAGMRRMILAQSAHFAKEFGDSPATARCLAALLRLMGEMEDSRYKHKKYWVGDLALSQEEERGMVGDDPFKWTGGEADGTRPSSVRWKDVVSTSASAAGKPLYHMHNAATQKLAMLYNLSSETLSRVPGVPDEYLRSNSRGGRTSSVAGSSPGGYADNYGGYRYGRSFSTFGQSSTAMSLSNLSSAFRGSNSGEGDTDDIRSESSESSSQHGSLVGAASMKGTAIDSTKPSRAQLSIPKIAPYVQNLVVKKKKHFISGKYAADLQRLVVGGSAGNGENTPSSGMGTVGMDAETKTTVSASPPTPPPSNKGVTAPTTYYGVDPTSRLGVAVELQKQSLNTLNQLCQTIPPATALELEGLPYLLRVRPLPDLEENTPRPLKVVTYYPDDTESNGNGQGEVLQSGGGQSALFYDPFEAKRAKARDRSSATSMLWCVGGIVRMEALFCNPLAVPLHLHEVHLIVEGVDYTSYPVQTTTVPPDTEEFKLTLTVCPRSVGPLTIKGVRYSIFNAIHTSFVDPASGLAVHDLSNEISSPWKYPRRVVSAVVKRKPSARRQPSTDPSAQSEDADEKSTKKKSTSRTDISIVPEMATLALWASWGSRVEHSPLVTGASEMNPLQIGDKNQELSASDPLSIFLFENETRRERIRLTNTSSSLKILDVRVTVHCNMIRSESPSTPKGSTKISYTLVPFSVLSLASQSTGPPLLPSSVFDNNDTRVFPFLVRVVSLETPGNDCALPILPNQAYVLELEFASYHSSELMPSTNFEIRVDVEYVTEFSGVEKYLIGAFPDGGAVESKSFAEKSEETIFARRVFILNEAVLVSSIKMERIVPLTTISSELRGSNTRLFPVHIEYPFLPEYLTGSAALSALNFIETCLRSLGISLAQYQHQHQRRLSASLGDTASSVSEQDAGASAKRQGLRFRELPCTLNGGMLLSTAGLQVACFNQSRLFSIQITNMSAFDVSISHCTSEGTGLDEHIWKYVYSNQGATVTASSESVQLAPFHSANVVLHITEDTLRKYLIHQVLATGCSYADAREKLASTIQFTWKIVETVREGVKGIANMTRSGKLSLLSVDESWTNALKLSQFSMTIRPPVAVSTPKEDLLGRHCSSPYLQLANRKFHRFVASIVCVSSACDSHGEHFCRRHVEVAFVVVDACDDTNAAGSVSLNSMHCPPSVVITGSPHKVLLVRNNETAPLEHAVDICFTRCGHFHVFTFARYRSLPHEQPSSDVTTSDDEHASSWWTLKEPISVAVR